MSTQSDDSTDDGAGHGTANSSETEKEAHGITIPTAERDAAIRRVYQEMGVPPTPTDMDRETEYVRDRWSNYRGPWDDVLRQADVPGRIDIIGLDVADRVAERHRWQDYITFKSCDVAESTGLFTAVVGNLLGGIADGNRAPDELDGVTIERGGISPETTPIVWRAEPAENADGGGEDGE